MKKICSFFYDGLLGLLVIAVLILTAPFILLSIPFKYLAYRKTHFRRDTGAKFSLWIMDSYTLKLYEIIKKHDLPIRFLVPKEPNDADEGWFVARTTLLVHDLSGLFYEEDLGGWTAYPEDREPLRETLEDIHDRLLTDHPDVVITDVKVLVEIDECFEEDLKRAENDPTFLLYSGTEQLSKVLQDFCAAA